MHGFVCPKCGSRNIGENIVDFDDGDEEFFCRDCHYVSFRESFIPKRDESASAPKKETKSDREN